MTPAATCRACGTRLHRTFCDLGMSPLSNRFLSEGELHAAEPFYPLHAYVCEACLLVQLQAFEAPERIFSDYAYFSSYSDTWLAHAERYVAGMVERLRLRPSACVVEIASNDGYLLQFFRQRGFDILGIEPAANVARVAQERGIPTRAEFFSARCAERLVAEGRRADLLAANNVLAHVPDLHDFVEGVRILLAPEGVATFEFPHLLRLMLGNQFDTIYHEHFSYFSLVAVRHVFARHDLHVFDVEELATHGGSLRLHVGHASARRSEGRGLAKVAGDERAANLDRVEGYLDFNGRAAETKRQLLAFLIEAKRAEKQIVGYGAAAKGNTLLNYCGIRNDFIDYVVDRSPHKQGRYLPGTHLRIEAPERIAETRPDYVLILPWNIRDEVVAQNAFIRAWGGRFVIPVPSPEVL